MHDLAGNRELAADPAGVYTTTYNRRNLPISVTNPAGKVVSYIYNALRQRRTMTDPDGGVFTYRYDHADRLESIVNPQGQTTTFSYDQLGRKVETLLANGAVTTHVYNCADWLTRIENGEPATLTFPRPAWILHRSHRGAAKDAKPKSQDCGPSVVTVASIAARRSGIPPHRRWRRTGE
jgi:YD repeat-containing protein